MSASKRVLESRTGVRLLLATAAVALLTGCSDATRLADNPFSNPFGSSAAPLDRTAVGTIAPRQKVATNTRIESQPLAAPTAQSIAPQPISTPAPAVQPVEPVAPRAASAAHGSWTSDGGTPVVVAQGETVGALSSRYGVPSDALLQTNGFSSASQVTPGARLVIPVYRNGGSPVVRTAAAPAATPAHAPAPAPVAKVEPKKETLKLVKGPEPVKAAPTKATPAKLETPKVAKAEPAKVATAKNAKVAKADDDEDDKPAAKAAPKPIAKADKAKLDAEKAKAEKAEKLAKAEKLKAEKAEAAKAEAAKVAEARRREEKKAAKVEEPKAKRQQTATVETPKPEAAKAEPKKIETAKAEAAKPEPKKVDVDRTTTTASLPAAEEKPSDSANPEFRWPARGRVIQSFKAGGNDGINIAVPEGTAVKAAEGGVVKYAGSELKGYGNLVLIQHPNGFVSAYAHNGELDVKRGDTVKRGQTIAKAGQTGNVTTPQVHFELRKGATPVDPTGYLAGL
jgi:murein DD-endopeptidase MepM/ murein hydrolase activator NlpD